MTQQSDNDNTIITAEVEHFQETIDAQVDKTVVRKRRWLLLLWTAFFWLLLAALAFGAWQLWQKGKIHQSQQQKKWQQQQTQMEQLAARLATLQEQIANQQQQLHLDKTQYQALNQRLDAQGEHLQRLSGSNRDSWLLEEARYLLRLANQRQLTGAHPEHIIALLAAADKLLRQIDMPDLFAIREALRQDMFTLKVAPKVDREGLYLTLQALANTLATLSPISVMPLNTIEQNTKEKVVENSPAPGHWHQRLWQPLQQVSEYLARYIRVRQHDQIISPLLSKSDQQQIQQSMILMVQQAQTALVREDSVIYQQSLKNISQWLQNYYHHAKQQEALLGQLEQLQQQPVRSQLPDISTSLVQLQHFIDNRRQLAQGADQQHKEAP